MNAARTQTRAFKVSEAEAIAIDAASQRSGKSMADFMRDAVLKETQKDRVIDGELKRLADMTTAMHDELAATKFEVIGLRESFDKALIVEFDEKTIGKQLLDLEEQSL